MTESKIARINALAHKAKHSPLTEEEKIEQAALRKEFLADVRASLQEQLAHTVVVEPDGSQPQELRRTLAFHYSRENLTHVINIMLLAKRAGLSIDRMESEDGRSFYKAVDFLFRHA